MNAECQNKASLLKSVNIDGLFLTSNIFLAPVAGYSDKAFRSICVDMGAGFTYTEMVSSEALVRSSIKTANLIEKAKNEKHYAVQLFGSNGKTMGEACKIILEHYAPSCIDINAGCPMQKINRSGAGAVLTRDAKTMFDVVSGTVKAADEFSKEHNISIPVTVKIRAGWSNSNLCWKEAAQAAIDGGAKAICMHPRTREQCYSGVANRDLIAELVDLCKPLGIPVFASGDLFTPEDVKTMFEQTGCDAVMLARGAMGNPFIFKQVRQYLETGSYDEISIDEKIKVGFKELLLLCEDEGEEKGCLEMRKRFSAYTKGIQNGGKLRAKLVQAGSIAEYKSILADYVDLNNM